MPIPTVDNLSHAILRTIAYSDIFEYPLTAREIHRYLTGLPASCEEVLRSLGEGEAWIRTGDYFTLPGRAGIISARTQREIHSRRLITRALNYGRILGALPFIRMVGLTGSLAVMNSSKDADFDYMLVAVPGRVWTARAFALLFNRFVRVFGDTICPNLIVSEEALTWPRHDLYSARELCQMVPITGMDVHQRLMKANQWAKEFLPNAWQTSEISRTSERSFRTIVELPLRGKLGDRFEQWEMERKIARFKRQAGFGEETVFNADVCQGNFDHHRKWTQNLFQLRIDSLDNDLPLPLEERLEVKQV